MIVITLFIVPCCSLCVCAVLCTYIFTAHIALLLTVHCIVLHILLSCITMHYYALSFIVLLLMIIVLYCVIDCSLCLLCCVCCVVLCLFCLFACVTHLSCMPASVCALCALTRLCGFIIFKSINKLTILRIDKSHSILECYFIGAH